MSILTFFRQKFCRGATLPSSPLPTGFTAITDHPSAGEVPPGCGLQSGAVPVNILISFWSWATYSAGGWVLSRAGLSLFLSVVMLPHHSGQIPETAALYSTRQILGEVSLHLMKRGQN
jgi:hypothetical protein